MRITKPLVTACPDAASCSCPCASAVTADCPVCSLLRGEERCNCDWSGDCVYYRFIWDGKKVPLPENQSKNVVVKKDTSNPFFVTLICSLPELLIKKLKPYQSCLIKSSDPYYSTTAVVVKIFAEEQLVVFAVQDDNMELPLKNSTILDKGTEFKIKLENLVLQMPQIHSTDVLIAVNGFWNGILPNVLTDLSSRNCKITCVGKISDNYIPILHSHNIKFTNTNTWRDVLNYIVDDKYKHVFLLNTPYWQKKLLDNLWPLKEKNIIVVGNDSL